MKTKNFLVLLTLGCLVSCQQNEQQEQNDAVINFSMSIDNDNLESVLTRSSACDYYAGKKSFSTGDIISMSASNYGFNSFTIGKEIRTWNEIGADMQEVNFYAHYPELSGYHPTENKRHLIGGNEYLFGMTKTILGTRDIALRFKRITVPVIILDEEGRPYDGEAVIKLHVKNQGIQDLMKGTITIDQNAKSENIEIKKLSDGFLTNLLPQVINQGDEFATISENGKTQTFRADRNISMTSGNSLVLRIGFNRNNGHHVIVDDEVPLRR